MSWKDWWSRPPTPSMRTSEIERQLENVERRIELLRLVWLNACEKQCSPPIEHDFELLNRAVADLRALVIASCEQRKQQEARDDQGEHD